MRGCVPYGEGKGAEEWGKQEDTWVSHSSPGGVDEILIMVVLTFIVGWGGAGHFGQLPSAPFWPSPRLRMLFAAPSPWLQLSHMSAASLTILQHSLWNSLPRGA